MIQRNGLIQTSDDVEYHTTKVEKIQMSLAMSILTRDEADIIEQNIRHHANQGVDCFIVTDNGSRDGTREILEQLSLEFDLQVIDEPSLTIDHDLWVTRMAYLIRDQYKADWIIMSKTDEFWMSDDFDLSRTIERETATASVPGRTIATLNCQRNSMIPSRELALDTNYSFLDNVYKVVETMADHDRPGSWHENNSNTLIKTIPSKIIARVAALTTNTSYLQDPLKPHNSIDSTSIRILHYPIRSYHQFEKKVVNFGRSMVRNKRFEQQQNRYLRYWFNLYQQGELMHEYLSIVLPEARLQELLEAGKVCIDDSLLNTATGYQRAA